MHNIKIMTDIWYLQIYRSAHSHSDPIMQNIYIFHIFCALTVEFLWPFEH